MNILLADKNSSVRTEFFNHINTLQSSELHFNVLEALSGREVLEMCKEARPALIFLDHESIGLEAVRSIRQLGGDAVLMPIVLLKESLSPSDIKECVDAGVDDILLKPVQSNLITVKIHVAMRQQKVRDQVFEIAHSVAISNRTLENIVTKDLLTGFLNEHSFEDALEKYWFKAKSEKSDLTLVYLSLDFFKSFNQLKGMGAGDDCIRLVAKLLKEELERCPQETMIARLAGATFGILLTKTNKEAAIAFMEHLRIKLYNLRIEHASSGIEKVLTASIGVSSIENSIYSQPWDLTEAADYALYQARHSGYNRVSYVPANETKMQ